MALKKHNLVAMVVGSAFLMQNLDGTIVATAIPQISVSLGSNPVRISVVIVVYLLSVAVFVPISGRLGDRFGVCNVYRAAVAIFTIASIFCGISQTPLELTIARIFQGLGGALMTPVGQLALLRAAPRSEFVRAMTYLTFLSQTGILLGPPLGGFITTFVSWRWIFLMNVPIGIVTIYFATRLIENFKEEQRLPWDWVGFVLNGIVLSCLMYGLEVLSRGAGSVAQGVVVLATGALVLPAAIWHARRHPHPQMDFTVLRIPTFRINASGGSFFRIGSSSVLFLVPLLFQEGFGTTAFVSGSLTCAMALGAMSVKLLGGPLLRRLGFKQLLIWNEIAGAALIAVSAVLTAATPALAVLAFLFLLGFSHSLQFTSLNTLSYADVDRAKMSAATGLAMLGNQVANGFGVAVAAMILHLSLLYRNADTLALPDLRLAFVAVAVISLGALAFFMRLDANAGGEISGRRPA